MKTRSQTQTKTTPKPSFTPVKTGLLQPKCACGNSASLTGKCTECENKRLTLQRRSANRDEVSQVPPIVYEVLNLSGQLLDTDTRTLMESRFGHDFRSVRVHTDAKAAESAQAVNALAYTVGQNIVFDMGQYVPSTREGRRLLAHELVHTIQQRKLYNNNFSGEIRLGAANDAYERSAELMAERGDSHLATEMMSTSGLLLQRTCRDHPDEAFYRSASNYCKDTGFSGSLHPGQRCYREVPRRSSYFQCPPGDQVCFDQQGNCHDSYDRVSTVESKDADGSCNLHGFCFLGHAAQDIVPGLLEESGRRQLECIRSCEDLPWYIKGFCLQGCSGRMPM